jgi:pimeloyl-ACP methyl ester carboxylesterase
MDDYFQQIDRYGPKSIVLDAEAIRYQLLGPEGKWRIFGQSFGASIVAYYLSMAPGSVEAAFMHGSSLTDDPKAWVKDRIKGQGRVLDQYFTRYPEDRQRLTQLKKSVSSSSCYGDSQAKICGPGIFDALYVRLGFKDAWEQLHQEITVLSQLKGPLLDIALQTQFFPKIRNEISIARYLIGNLVAGSDLRQTCQAAIQDLRTEGYDVQNQLINDCHLLSAIWTSWDKDLQKFANSQFLSVAQFKNDLELTLTSATLPVYIYSGELDSFSPKETFGPFVQALKGLVNYLHFLQSGHEGYYSEDQIIVDLYKPKTVKEKSQSAAFEP